MKNLDEFDFPIRAYWDLTDGTGAGAEPMLGPDAIRKICDELTGIKVLTLDLLDIGPVLGRQCIGALERLKNENLAVTLIVSAAAMDVPTAGFLAGMRIRSLLVDILSAGEISGLKTKVGGLGPDVMTGVYYRVGRNNYLNLPEVLSMCVENGVKCLVLPMQRLASGKEFFYISRKEREELGLRIGGIRKDDMRIIINDPFLWKAFFPADPYHERGCQAANSMIYISPSGDVYPCPALPVKLGNLSGEALKDILLSGSKIELRRRLGAPPTGCSGCRDEDACMGGCRGRAYAAKGSFDGPDPSCS